MNADTTEVILIEGPFKVSKNNNKYDDMTMMTVSKHNLNNIKCNHCNQVVNTECVVQCGSKIQWIGFATLFILGIIFSWIPLVIKKFHKHSHNCQRCKKEMFNSNSLSIRTQWKNAFNNNIVTQLD